MQIVLLGTGNTATVLGRLMLRAGHQIVQVYGRTLQSARDLASELNGSFSDQLDSINQSADIYIIAVSDNAVESVARSIRIGNKMLVHTAGSVSIDKLSAASRNYGILYPLQSLRKENKETPDVPFLIDGNTVEDITLVEDFAATLSKQVARANDEQRMKYHLSAVLVNNFTNHLYTLVKDYCDQSGANFSMLLPLIQQLSLRLNNYAPAELQTGPAIRNDRVTIERHLSLLNEHPELQKIYALFTDSIRTYYSTKENVGSND